MSSLGRRLLGVGGTLLLLFTVMTGLALEWALTRYTQQAEYERLQGLVFTLLGAMDVANDGTPRIRAESIQEPRLGQLDSGLGASIYNAKGAPVWRSFSQLDTDTLSTLPEVNEWRFSAGESFRLSYGIEWLASRKRQYRFTVSVEESESPLQTQRMQFTRQLWTWLALSTLLLLLTLLALMRWAIRPLTALTTELDDVRNGTKQQLSTRVPAEILPLTQGLNTLLAHQHQQQSRFRDALADLAHSLKTPLTVVQGSLREHPNPLAAEQIERMQQIIGYQLQRAATMGGKALQSPRPVRPVVERLVGALTKVYHEKQIQFDIELPASFTLAMEEDDLLELLGNLLDNAAKYGRHRVWVGGDGQRPDALCIDDDGPGFPAAAQRLLERGARADSRQSGQGIGLAVALDIVRAYGAELHLTNSPLGGARVIVEQRATH
ncbi:MAG: ATP-binding protein [Thiotrichales bacterium]